MNLFDLKSCVYASFYSLFPETCVVCGGYLSRYIPILICDVCEATVVFEQKRTIEPFPTLSLIDYEHHVIKRLLTAVKFERNKRIADAFSDLILKKMPHSLFIHYSETVWVPIPVHDKRKLERGYNQVDMLFAPVASHFGISFFPAIKRIKYTDPLFGLSVLDRAHMVKDAFVFDEQFSNQIVNKHVWLVDDIVTTGVSLKEAATVLYAQGAKSVMGFTLAKTELQTV